MSTYRVPDDEDEHGDGPMVLAPCATRYSSSAQLIGQMTAARCVGHRLTVEDRAVLLALGARLYDSWALAERHLFGGVLPRGPAAVEHVLRGLAALGLVEDHGAKLDLSSAGYEVWAQLDASRGADPLIRIALSAVDVDVLEALARLGCSDDASAPPRRLPVAALAAAPQLADASFAQLKASLSRLLALRAVDVNGDGALLLPRGLRVLRSPPGAR